MQQFDQYNTAQDEFNQGYLQDILALAPTPTPAPTPAPAPAPAATNIAFNAVDSYNIQSDNRQHWQIIINRSESTEYSNQN